MSTLWPRLEQSIATARLADLKRLSPEAVRTSSALAHPGVTYASTGGVRATEAELASLRAAIVEVAQAHGFPQAGNAVAFDRALAVRLLGVMPMADGEALQRPVWSFVALVLAPDVTYWRFVRDHDKWNDERWVCTDRTRHMFSRLWWQARQLTVPTAVGRDTSLLDGLTESELNHLTERTSIGGCGPLVRAMAKAVLALPAEYRQRDVVREGALRLLRTTGVVDAYSLTEEQLAGVAERSLLDALGAIVTAS
jgi:hypothetical protein